MGSNINKVDNTMEAIREQMDLSNEISEAISNPVNMGIEVDDVRKGRFLFPTTPNPPLTPLMAFDIDNFW